MKSKIALSLSLISIGTLSFANSKYKDFQEFDNQVGFGLNYQNGNLNNSQSNANPNQFSITSLNLEVEKLFDIGIWGDFNASVAQTYTQTIDYSATLPPQPVGSYPFLQTMNLKLGYNFPILHNLALTPYVTLGKNANLTTFTTIAGISPSSGIPGDSVNVTNDFYYTYGGGLRLEYIINKYVDVYLDQLYAFNNDQTNYSFIAPTKISTSNNQMTTTLGVKINPWEKLQLGANLLYTNYYGYDTGSINFLNAADVAVPTTAFGFQVSAGFTFE